MVRHPKHGMATLSAHVGYDFSIFAFLGNRGIRVSKDGHLQPFVRRRALSHNTCIIMLADPQFRQRNCEGSSLAVSTRSIASTLSAGGV